MNGVLRKAAIWSVLTIGVVTAAGAMGRGSVAGSPAAAGAGQAPAGLPDGDGKKFVSDNCVSCHPLDNIVGAKHDLAGWNDALARMVTYGAEIPAAQMPTVAAYLAKNFTANPPKADDTKKPDDKEKAKDAAGEKILNDGCTSCHDLGPITRRADDRAAWESVVYGMIGNGADVKDADIPTLVDYLVKYYGPPKEAPKPAAPAAPAAPAGRGGRGARGQ